MSDSRLEEKKIIYRKYDIIWYLLTFIIVVFLDQTSKLIAKKNLDYTYCTFFLKFSPIINHGIAFGLFSNSSILNQYILSFFSIIALSLLFYIFIRKYFLDKNGFVELLVISASFSNILDRYLYGGIIDFITINFIHIVFPIGNIADIIIVFGIGYIMFKFYYDSEKFLEDEIF